MIKIDSSGNVQWNKTYVESSVDEGWAVIQTSDGGYAFAGFTDLADQQRIWLVKTDSNGNELWNKTYEGDGGHADSLLQTKNGDYVMLTTTISYGFGLIETDSKGNVLWSKTYTFGDQDSSAYSFVQTSDGGFALAGDVGNSTRAFVLIKTDANGNMTWTKTYPATVNGTQIDVSATGIIQTSDHGYAFSGSSTYPNDFAWLVKTDASGNEQWNQTYADAGAWCLIQTSDNGFALGGEKQIEVPSTNTDGVGSTMTGDTSWFWLVKTDQKGNMLWNETYDSPLHFGGAEAIVATKDGGYAIAGFSEVMFGPEETWMVKTNNTGIIPEFPSSLIALIAIVILTLFSVVFTKKKLNQKHIRGQRVTRNNGLRKSVVGCNSRRTYGVKCHF